MELPFVSFFLTLPLYVSLLRLSQSQLNDGCTCVLGKRHLHTHLKCISRVASRQSSIAAAAVAVAAAAKIEWWLSANDEHVRSFFFFHLLFHYLLRFCSLRHFFSLAFQWCGGLVSRVHQWAAVFRIIFKCKLREGTWTPTALIVFYFFFSYQTQASWRACKTLSRGHFLLLLAVHIRVRYACTSNVSFYFLFNLMRQMMPSRSFILNLSPRKGKAARIWCLLSLHNPECRARALHKYFHFGQVRTRDVLSRFFVRFHIFSPLLFPHRRVVVIWSRELNCSNVGSDDDDDVNNDNGSCSSGGGDDIVS